MLNNLYQSIKTVLILTVIIGIVGMVCVAIKWGGSLVPARTITVSASAQTTVSPDLATISFSEVTIGADPVKIEADNATLMNGAISFVKKQGIVSNDIATTDYNLSPNYSYNEKTGRTAIVSYTITETETIKIRDFTKIAPILSGLTDLGVNQVSQVSFSVEDPDSHLADARKQAFTKAELKAKQMAAANGIKLGKVMGFSESTNNVGPLPIYNVMAMSSKAIGGAVAPTIESGTQQLTDQVSVTYEIQ